MTAFQIENLAIVNGTNMVFIAHWMIYAAKCVAAIMYYFNGNLLA